MNELSSLLAYGSGWGDELLRGLVLTLSIAALAYGIGLALGFLAALAELSRKRLVARAFAGYAAALRSVPELLVIFFLYFGGSYLLGLALAPFGVGGFVEVERLLERRPGAALWSRAPMRARCFAGRCWRCRPGCTKRPRRSA